MMLALLVAIAAQVAEPAPPPATPPTEPPTEAAPTTPPSPPPPTTTAPPPTTTVPAATGAVVNEKPNILVLDFRDDGVGPSAVRIIHDTLVSHVSKDSRLVVLSSEDVRRAVQLEAERREVTNCDEEGCIAEIAEALGAQLTLFGTAGKLGDLVVVNVNLYDARAAKSVGRETIEVSSLESLPNPLRRAGDKLIAQLFGEPISEDTALGPLFWTSSAVAGAGLITAIVGVSVFGANITAVDEAVSFTDKSNAKFAQDAGLNTLVIGAAVLVIGGVAAGAAIAIE